MTSKIRLNTAAISTTYKMHLFNKQNNLSRWFGSKDIWREIIWGTKFDVNTQYRHDRRLCSIRLLFVAHFSRTYSCFFLPTTHTALFFQLFLLHFYFQPFTPRVSAKLCHLKLTRLSLSIHANRQKGSHSFNSKVLQSTTSHYSSPSVSVVCYPMKYHQYT